MGRDFDEVYQATYRSVLRTVVLLTPSVEDAHDVVQEAFARALERWTSVRELDKPHECVRRVAVNAALGAGRRETSRRGVLRRLAARRPADVEATGGDRVDVVRALQQLTPRQRQAVVLHHLLDLDVASIAAETGTPVGTVKTDLFRGRAALAQLLRVEEVALDV